jgi:hypothetical protein
VPFVLGVAVGGRPRGDAFALFVAALAGFHLHHPAAIAVKALVGRRPRSDLAPAAVWIGIDGVVAALAIPCVVAHGHARILWLLVPAGVVFAVHLLLVARKAERRQETLEVLFAAVLALAAPAAYWVSGGVDPWEPWILAGASWLAVAAGIANVHLRLRQRAAKRGSPAAVPWRGAVAALALPVVGVVGSAAGLALSHAPPVVLLAFLGLFADALASALRPDPTARPVAVGIREALVLLAFTVALAAGWNLRI